MNKIMLYCVCLGGVAFLPVRQRSQRTSPTAFTLNHNRFAFHLLRAVLAEDTGSSNKLISPLSVNLALAMLYNGAAHATRDSIGEVLQDDEIDAGGLNARCKELQQQLPLEDNQVQFSMANAIWYNRRKLSVLPAFEAIADQYYYSLVQGANFSSRGTVAQINEWADQHTNHRITEVMSHMSSGDGICLVDAPYFKSNWQRPFEVSNTRPDIFHLRDGGARAVPFMREVAAVTRTFSDTSFTMVELPYGQGHHYALYVLLPEDDRRPIAEWAAALNPDRLYDAMGKMTDQLVDLDLPRWEYTYCIDDLRGVLGRLGMGIAFSGGAGVGGPAGVAGVDPEDEPDFSNMFAGSSRSARISQAVHKTWICVNEQGTGVAATTIRESQHAGEPEPLSRRTRVIRADHPFLYIVMEKQQHLILLTGIVNDPSSGGVVMGVAAPVRKKWKLSGHR